MKSVSGMTLLLESAVGPDGRIRGNRTHQKRINDDAEGKSGNAGRHQVKETLPAHPIGAERIRED